MCLFTNIPHFLPDISEEGFESTNNNQKIFIFQAKSIIG